MQRSEVPPLRLTCEHDSHGTYGDTRPGRPASAPPSVAYVPRADANDPIWGYGSDGSYLCAAHIAALAPYTGTWRMDGAKWIEAPRPMTGL